MDEVRQGPLLSTAGCQERKSSSRPTYSVSRSTHIIAKGTGQQSEDLTRKAVLVTKGRHRQDVVFHQVVHLLLGSLDHALGHQLLQAEHRTNLSVKKSFIPGRLLSASVQWLPLWVDRRTASCQPFNNHCLVVNFSIGSPVDERLVDGSSKIAGGEDEHVGKPLDGVQLGQQRVHHPQ